MIELITILLMLCAIGMVAVRWRLGLFVCVVVALLQDPLRKLAPGKPVFYVILVGVTFGAAWLGAWASRVRLSPDVIYGWRRDLQTPVLLFAVVLIAQSLHTMLRWNNAILPFIGAIFYVAPMLAIIFAHQYCVRAGTAGLQRVLWFYVVLALVWFLSIYLESAGVKSVVLGEVGVGQFIYGEGLNVKANSGFFRAAEIAAWHVSTTACFLFIALNGRKLSVPKTLLVACAVVFLVVIGLATGRRKMLVQIVIFASVYMSLFAWFLKGTARLAVGAVVAGIVGFSLVLTAVGPDADDAARQNTGFRVAQTDRSSAWVNRGLSVFADIPDRFEALGYRPVAWATDSFGWFGAGLGTASQGGQYFGRDASFGGAGEGGLGKVTMDLGLPGLAVFLWLAVTIIRLIWQRLHVLSRASRPHATMAFGFAAFLISNVAAFSVATQAFGDVFILLTLGWTIGFLLALPAAAGQEIAAAARTAQAAAVQNSYAMPTPVRSGLN